ncbi:MAG: hypothetical protein H6779_00125 [Candidatus Nomurabacteria bacterium]|nr:MAG: hypothetical protein H6779_00125 [Candidatus Nomurabacteria bacterium]
MIQRSQLESILKINGVNPSSSDEVIRSVLVSARYNDDEIDTAMMVLRENTKDNTTRVDGLHKIFRTDDALRPKEISALLGVEVSTEDPGEIRAQQRKQLFYVQTILVIIFSVILAAISVLVAMYIYKVGLFHETASAFQY